MNLDDLSREEQTALGSLIRMMVRSDGQFSEAEEAAINAIGDEIGGQAVIWRVISQSAQDCPEESAGRAWVLRVQRTEAREFIREVITRVAASDDLTEREHELLAWLRSAWA